MSKELIEKLREYAAGEGSVQGYMAELMRQAADALEAKVAPVGEREAAIEAAYAAVADRGWTSVKDMGIQMFQAGAAYQRAQQPQSAEAVAFVKESQYLLGDTSDEISELLPIGTKLYTTPQPSAGVVTNAARDVLAERQRQISAEGWSPEHDDQYHFGQLASAAGCYAMYTLAYPVGDPHPNWPWDKAWWKPSQDGRRNLVKAGALILAEIERLDRLNGKEVGRG